MVVKNKKRKNESSLTSEQRRKLYLSKCFVLCPKCWSVQPLLAKTCSTCMEILDPKERLFHKNLNKHNNTNKSKHIITIKVKNKES